MNIKSNYIIVTVIVMDTGPLGHYMLCMLQPIPRRKHRVICDFQNRLLNLRLLIDLLIFGDTRKDDMIDI